MPFSQQNLLCLYRYDPLDRLISHTQFQASPLQRFYCKSRLATEIQGALHHSIVQHDDQLLAQQQRQDDVLDTTLLATDLQRSILQMLKANQPRHSIAFSPYGHRHPENGLLSLLGFNGERPDSVTGHYLLGNGYRAFNPVLMRFNSPDSWSPFGKGGLNSYVYCLGDPVNFSDPTGHGLGSIVKGVKSTFRSKMKPGKVDAPVARLLEDIPPETFQKITTYLDQADMDNLAQVSHGFNKKSVSASVSNLKEHISSFPKNDRTIPLVLDRERLAEGLNGFELHQAPTGIGSAAFKKLDPTIKNSTTLRAHNIRTRNEGNFRDMNEYPDDKVWELELNRRHSKLLLNQLEN